jgi:hypothetical protein
MNVRMKETKVARLIIVSTSYYCCGVIIDGNNIVVEAAPIVAWMKGKNIITLYESNKHKITFSK